MNLTPPVSTSNFLVLDHAGAQFIVIGARRDRAQPAPACPGILLVRRLAILNAILGGLVGPAAVAG
jgi:hypothetical protein